MIFTLPLKKNDDFRTVYKKGRSKAERFLIIYVMKNGLNENRLGVSVSKKVGNSVVRHRVKRLVKECYRLRENMFINGIDIVFLARKGADKLDFSETEREVMRLMTLSHAVIKEKGNDLS